MGQKSECSAERAKRIVEILSLIDLRGGIVVPAPIRRDEVSPLDPAVIVDTDAGFRVNVRSNLMGPASVTCEIIATGRRVNLFEFFWEDAYTLTQEQVMALAMIGLRNPDRDTLAEIVLDAVSKGHAAIEAELREAFSAGEGAGKRERNNEPLPPGFPAFPPHGERGTTPPSGQQNPGDLRPKSTSP